MSELKIRVDTGTSHITYEESKKMTLPVPGVEPGARRRLTFTREFMKATDVSRYTIPDGFPCCRSTKYISVRLNVLCSRNDEALVSIKRACGA